MANKNYEHKIEIEEEEDGEIEVDLNWKPPKEGEEEAEFEVPGLKAKKEVEEPEEPEEEELPAPKAPDPELVALKAQLAQIREEQAERDRLAAEGYSAYEEQQIDGKLTAARAKFKAAQDAGDSEAALAAMDEITDLKVAKEARKYAKPQPEPRQRQQPEAAQNPLTNRWIANNPWYGKKEHAAETIAVRVIDADMVAEGWQPNTEDYFDEMSRRLAKKFKSVEVASISKKRQPPPKTAPVSGAQPAVTRKGVIKLDRKDFEIMRMTGLDPNNAKHRVDYAREKINYRDEA